MASGELDYSKRSYAGSGELVGPGKASDASTIVSGSISLTSSMDRSTKSSLSSCVTVSRSSKGSLTGKMSIESQQTEVKRNSLEDPKGVNKWDNFGETHWSGVSCASADLGEASDDGESVYSSASNSFNKPHKANDSQWEAIQSVWARESTLGLSNFRLLKKLGSGDIGSVYLSELRGTNCYFAMKVMDKGSLVSRKKLLRSQTEREILQCLDHPFLPSLYTHFETDKFTCLVMEFCPGGDLHISRQRKPGKYFPEMAAKFYAAEVLLALEYLHMMGIIYRDLKPENVLVRQDGHIMLSDFDLSLRCVVRPTLVKSASMVEGDSSRRIPAYCVQPACEPACITPACVAPTCLTTPCLLPKLLTSLKIGRTRKLKCEPINQAAALPELLAEPTGAHSMSFVGTHEYLAPEIIKGEGHGSAVDWWTFGIFLYELLHGRTPFKGSGNRATLFNVVGQPLRFPEVPIVSYAAKDLINGLLVKDPHHRLGYKRGSTEIKQHPFFEGVNWALIRSMVPPEVPRPFELNLSSSVGQSVGPVTSSGNGYTNAQSGPSASYLDFDFF
ncbi:hypothetical protein KP509_04G038400 [Ceratopteris richardii]|uniref:non-specific serine/threonine protein kinase n=1 Tax=Ceratopteris richardii TaxID=49495 RepID=A0A8T2UYH8_CERRI|nr:hypothetical protein KP509_04G038400 [Ceratopteris richardii]KAH7438956.1 hypothetical protein KP509_04G038400 [Ceratopteris richardii]